ncbi:MAG: glycine oxidase ThiO [Elusimicrobia bacterium]|nr:glycine oxidase ThiO [Elusimicrobiota bacterium]
MNHSFDVVVVGGGVIGCSTAFHLARKGAKVMVVDKRAIGGHALSLTAGILAAQMEAEAPDAFFDLRRASRALFPSLVDEIIETSGMDPEFEVSGVWHAAASEQDKIILLEKKRWQEERALSVEWVEPDVLKGVHPGIGENRGALFCPSDAQIESGQWVQALAEASRRKGVRFLDHVPPPLELVRDRRRVAGVRTKDDLISCDQVVLAAGAWTSFLLDQLRISLPLEPVKGELMVLAGVPRAFRGPVYATSGYVVPHPDGRLVIGATEERVGFNAQPTLEAQRNLADWAALWCPGLSGLPVVEFQAGLRPGTADSWPIMGRLWDYDNLFISAGHFKSGILLSPFAGQFMADGILDGRWDPLGAPFSPERFHGKGGK